MPNTSTYAVTYWNPQTKRREPLIANVDALTAERVIVKLGGSIHRPAYGLRAELILNDPLKGTDHA